MSTLTDWSAVTSRPEETIYLLGLLQLDGIGIITSKNLIAYAGSARNVFDLNAEKLQKIPGIGLKVVHILQHAHRNLEKIYNNGIAELEKCEKAGIKILTFLDADFPAYLKTDISHPAVLFIKGHLNLNDQPAIAIVGTRKPSEYGRKHACRFAEYFAQAGLNVVSGLAYGIDAEVHKTVLANTGKTTAVLGHGLHRVYPSAHKNIADKICNAGGVIMSEYRWGIEPEANNFPERNRIIAGLCRAVIVIEAGATGGALITARLGFDMNREIFALPGNVESRTSLGCHALIQKNIARLVMDPEEVMQELKLTETINQNQQTSLLEPPPNLTEMEAVVYGYLTQQGKVLDELNAITQIPIHQLSTVLLDLEFKGLVTQVPGRKFVRA